MNVHGRWSQNKMGNAKTESYSKRMIEMAEEVPYPTIICGDFNLFPDTKSIQILNEEFENLVEKYNINSTRPESNELSHKERNVVDYIFISEGISVKDFKVVREEASDHFPLVLDFEIV